MTLSPGTSLQTPEVAQIALEKLCPAIYALLSDGLLPSLHSLFGKISNSVWRVVEATSQMGKRIIFSPLKLVLGVFFFSGKRPK